MKQCVGRSVLVISALGYPLTEVVLRRGGRTGIFVVAGACFGLTVRDAAMIASGTPERLRKFPAMLLYLELGAAFIATLASLPRLRKRGAAGEESVRVERLRRTATLILFGLHTIRFYIYLQPNQGRGIEYI